MCARSPMHACVRALARQMMMVVTKPLTCRLMEGAAPGPTDADAAMVMGNNPVTWPGHYDR